MFSVKACAIPDTALLSKYRHSGASDSTKPYADCYVVNISGVVSLAEFVFAFYTTPVFRLERVILTYRAHQPSTDDQARRVADGSADAFAAWTVEQRADEQLLLCDVRGRTRSWFRVTPSEDRSSPGTILWFGSAVVPRKNIKTGQRELGRGFSLLLGFHTLYSKVLLASAKRRLEKRLG